MFWRNNGRIVWQSKARSLSSSDGLSLSDCTCSPLSYNPTKRTHECGCFTQAFSPWLYLLSLGPGIADIPISYQRDFLTQTFCNYHHEVQFNSLQTSIIFLDIKCITINLFALLKFFSGRGIDIPGVASFMTLMSLYLVPCPKVQFKVPRS